MMHKHYQDAYAYGVPTTWLDAANRLWLDVDDDNGSIYITNDAWYMRNEIEHNLTSLKGYTPQHRLHRLLNQIAYQEGITIPHLPHWDSIVGVHAPISTLLADVFAKTNHHPCDEVYCKVLAHVSLVCEMRGVKCGEGYEFTNRQGVCAAWSDDEGTKHPIGMFLLRHMYIGVGWPTM